MDDSFFTFLLLSAIFIIGWNCGSTYTLYKLNHLLVKLAKTLNANVVQESGDIDVAHLEIMVHDKILYLYDRVTNDFICQGSTIEELAQLSKEYKNINNALVKHEDSIIMFIDGVVTKP